MTNFIRSLWCSSFLIGSLIAGTPVTGEAFVFFKEGATVAQARSGREVYSTAYDAWSKGNQRKTEKLLDEGIHRFPGDQSLLFFRAACFRSRFDFTDAAGLFTKVSDLNLANPEGQCAYHMLELDRVGMNDFHLTALRRLADEHPENLLLRWMLAVQCRTYDLDEEGVAQYEKILGKVAVGSSLVHQTYGNLLDNLNRHEEALVHRVKAVELEPAPWTHQAMANTLSNLERFDEADAWYRKAVAEDPGCSLYWQTWGRNSMLKGDFTGATWRSMIATVLNPQNESAWEVWGISMVELERFEEALEKLTKALRLDPDDPYVYAKRGKAYAQLGQYQSAIDDYEKALLAFPDDVLLRFEYAHALESSDRFKEAIRQYSRIIAAAPDFSGAYCNRGFAYQKLEEVQRAIEDYQAAIKLDSRQVTAFRNLGLIYANSRDLSNALECFQRLVEIEPDKALAYNDLGYTYYLDKKYPEAIAAYEKALAVNPKFGLCHYNKAMAHYQNQEFDQAVFHYDQAVANDYPGSPAFGALLEDHRE